MQTSSFNTRRASVNTWIFIFFITVSFYSIGAGCVESLVNYPLWYIIGPSDVWTNYHIALGPKIIATLAIPALLLQLLSNVLLIFYRPPAVPAWTVWATLLLVLIFIVSSFVIQIPIQFKLDAGYNKEMVDHLISSDLLLRVSIGFIRGIIIIYMMNLYMRTNK